MKLFRKALFWLHLTIGVIAGLVIFIMSVTGVLLTYEKQIIHWADTRNYQVEPPSPGASRLSVETLLARVGEAQPGASITTITLRSGASEPAAVALASPAGAGPGGARTIYVNPYNSVVLGEGAKNVRNFFHVVTDWHRWLGAHGESRNTARAITGACNLGFLFIVISGIYLWWPRKRNWSQFKSVLWFKRGLPGKARDFNWHNVIGFWSFTALFIIVLSAVVISYPWASDLVYRLVGENPPARAPQARQATGNAAQQRGGADRQDAAPPLDNLDGLWSRAAQQVAGWRSISLRIPASPDAPLIFTIDQGNGGQPQKRSQLTLDRETGEVVRWEPFSSYTTGRKLRSFLRFAHTGEVAGVAGQTIAGLASLGGVFLFWTGISLALRRFRAWLGRRAGATVQSHDPLTETATGD
ncbi:MAG TPA: PepSY-associated TM helix domain-containing protein [Blastocatellia bacterium]|nr:PepSY-associated TM helix domain-containing protein [Blastocatellia bacterium]